MKLLNVTLAALVAAALPAAAVDFDSLLKETPKEEPAKKESKKPEKPQVAKKAAHPDPKPPTEPKKHHYTTAKKDHGPHWGYEGKTGPAHWGGLSPQFRMCGMGRNQSPINISGALKANLSPIEFNYKPSALHVLNNGHTIKVDYDKGSSIIVDGRFYKLLQFHWHTPSENTINGKYFPMEAHLVHADREGNLAVVGVMYQIGGKADPYIGKIWKQMPKQAGEKYSSTQDMFDANALLPKSRDYYRFSGSLTTPPCSEGVLWMVMKEPVKVSKEQVYQFHGAMGVENNRPVQPNYARQVLQ